MRAPDSALGSPSLEPDRAAVEEDVNPPHHGTYSPGSPLFHLSAPATLESISPFDPPYTYTPPAPTLMPAASPSAASPTPDALDESDDHDMLDAEEGGAPLHNYAMTDDDDTASVSLDNDDADHGIYDDADDVDDGLPDLPLLAPAPAPALSTQQPIDQDGPPDAADPLTAQIVEQAEAEGFDVETMDLADQEPPPFLTHQNAGGTLMPDNHNCHDFLRYWAWLKRHGKLRNIDLTPYNPSSVVDPKKTRIEYADLQGDSCDLQGINWRHMGITRTLARRCRVKTFRNYVNITRSDVWNRTLPDRLLSNADSYYQFRSMDIRDDVRLLHFQLRHILGCASRTRVFYPTPTTIRELDPTTGRSRVAMSFDNYSDSFTSTLAAEEGILLAGSFYGTYHYRSLNVENGAGEQTTGRLTDHPSGITNHVQITTSRHSSVPLAAFASNDCGYRVVDLATNQIILRKKYPWALNCSSLSPDKRLRVMVGDTQDVVISDAETGQIFQSLEGHRDFGFACAWSPDGWTVATGNQDKSIRIWDARKWRNSKGESTCVSVLRTEMTGVRSLRFSPLGSGKRLLAAAEEADFINIIDAETFNSKQTISIFGELAGISFASGGDELIGLSSDPDRGGILSLERCGSRLWQGHDDYALWNPTQRRRQAAMAYEDWHF